MGLFSRLSPYEKGILENVKRSGCHVTVVGDPEGDQPNFAYSAGFITTVNQPEVIVFGLPLDFIGQVVNETFDRCRQGLRLEDGVAIDGLLANHICIAREIGPDRIEREYLNSAMWYAQHVTKAPMKRAMQIVWPDSQDGLFPWDEGCSDLVRAYQPALYERELNS